MERRSLLKIVGATGVVGLAGCTGSESSSDTQSPENEALDSDTPSDSEEDPTTTEETTTSVSFTLDNVGSSAWEITDSSESVGQEGTENPTLHLETGTRYVVTNAGWDGHPLAFRTQDRTALLSQDSNGELEDESSVNWVDNDETIEFTFTDSFAARVDEYYCTIHGFMWGSVQTEGDSTGY